MHYNKLAQEVHEENKAKGFYDVEPSSDMSLLLIVSELMEMVEADRKGHELSSAGEIIATNLYNGNVDYSDGVFKQIFNDSIKDTIEDEAADVIIRILDYAGWQNKYLALRNNSDNFFKELPHNGIKADDIWDLIKTIEACRNDYHGIAYLFHVCIIYFTKSLNIDIWKHVELKRKYNKLRPIRNGKKY